jgi:hypothetical protein
VKLAAFMLALVSATTAAWATPEVLWRIGAPDNDYHEFALSGEHGRYFSQFPEDVVFRVGESRAEESWPYFQPGPGYGFGWGSPHPFRVEFDLKSAPPGASKLTLDLAAVTGGLLEVNVNDRMKCRFRLPATAEKRALTDPAAGREFLLSVPFSSKRLRQGRNHLTITLLAGSWLLYDALWLEGGLSTSQGPVLTSLEAESTLFFAREKGRLKQAIHVSLNNEGGEGKAEVRLSGARRKSQTLALTPGLNVFYLLVEPFARPQALRLSVRAGESEPRLDLEGRPERRWKVYVGPSTHTDIGYTDWQERVFELHNANTSKALQACAADPSFKWNLEVAFQASLFRQQHPEAFAQLARRLREGRIGLPGLYLNMLTGLCSGEELIQALDRPQKLGRELGLPVESANLTDVPSSVGTMPMFLSHSGVRYFAEAVNQWRGPFFRHADPRLKQAPFWWEGLDGSRVLAIFADVYAQATRFGLVESKETAMQRLPGWLKSFDREDYPSDAVYVYGAFSDNLPLNPHYAEVAREWNRQWAYPRILVSRVDEFFRYVEESFGKQLPVFKGDPGVYWEDGATSSAEETALVRWAKQKLESAEAWHALAAALDSPRSYPAKEINSAWEETLFYDEHTWGAHCSISQPEHEQTKHQWAFKAAYARRAAEQAEALHSSGKQAIGRSAAGPQGQPASGRAVTVWNECSWPRDLLVAVPLPQEEGQLLVREAADERPLPVQQEKGELLFLAESVPSLGYKSYLLEPGRPDPQPDLLRPGSDEWTWEAPDFSLRFDPGTGALSSLEDRRLGRDWVDAASGYGLNQFLYALGGEGSRLVQPHYAEPKFELYSHTQSKVQLVENGPLRAVLHLTRRGPNLPPTDTFVVLHRKGRLDFINVVHKEPTTAKEAGYFAFPFKLERPQAARAFVELPYGVLRVEEEQLPGGCREWYASHSFAAVSDGQVTAYLATPHAPMLTIGDIFRGLWKANLEKIDGKLFAYVFNNYWDTNYKASQGGDLLFAFSLRLRAGDFDPLEATRFGWEALANMLDPRRASQPDLWRAADAQGAFAELPAAPEKSLLRLLEGQAVIGGLRREGDQLQVRLYNPSFQATRAVISLPDLEIKEAWRTNLTGRREQRIALEASTGALAVSVPARGLATLALTTKKKPASGEE